MQTTSHMPFTHCNNNLIVMLGDKPTDVLCNKVLSISDWLSSWSAVNLWCVENPVADAQKIIICSDNAGRICNYIYHMKQVMKNAWCTLTKIWNLAWNNICKKRI